MTFRLVGFCFLSFILEFWIPLCIASGSFRPITIMLRMVHEYKIGTRRILNETVPSLVDSVINVFPITTTSTPFYLRHPGCYQHRNIAKPMPSARRKSRSQPRYSLASFSPPFTNNLGSKRLLSFLYSRESSRTVSGRKALRSTISRGLRPTNCSENVLRWTRERFRPFNVTANKFWRSFRPLPPAIVP
jgi:hypothetical protein